MIDFLELGGSLGFIIAVALIRLVASDPIESIMEGKKRNILNNATFIIVIATLITYFSFVTSYTTNRCHFFIILLIIAIAMTLLYFKIDQEMKKQVPLYCICMMLSCFLAFIFKRLSLNGVYQIGNDEGFVISDDVIKLLMLWIINIIIAWEIIVNFRALNIPVYIYRDGAIIGIMQSRVDDYILYKSIKTNKNTKIKKSKLLPISELTKGNYYLSTQNRANKK